MGYFRRVYFAFFAGLLSVILLLASSLFLSTTFTYLCVVVMDLWAIILRIVLGSVPAAARSVANVQPYECKVMFYLMPAELIKFYIGN